MKLTFRPSGAHRWMECSGYPRVAVAAKKFGEPSSPYASEGKEAHRQLAQLLSGQPCPEASDIVRESADAVQAYVEMLGGDLQTEITLPIKIGDHKLEGTLDILIKAHGNLTVIDYKHGVGVPVSPVENPQLALYALAALQHYPSCREVTVAILQPRSAYGESLAFWTPSRYWLDEFAIRAKIAINESINNPQYRLGDHCRMCSGLRGYCPAQLGRMVDLTCEEIDTTEAVTDARPWWLIDAAPQICGMLTRLHDQAVTTIRMGGKVPGHTLVTTESSRKWADPSTAARDLTQLLGGNPDDYSHAVPIGIGDAEKIAKSKALEVLGKLTGGAVTSWRQKKKLDTWRLTASPECVSTLNELIAAGNTISINGLTETSMVEKLVKSGNEETAEEWHFEAIEGE